MTCFARVFVVVLFAVAAAGQVKSIKSDIPEIRFLSLQETAKGLLGESNYRMTKTFEYFDGSGKAGDLIERRIEENLSPSEWRLIVESNYPKPVKRSEYIYYGNVFFRRIDSGKWTTPQHMSTDLMLSWDSEHKNVKYRYLGQSLFNGAKAEKYEVESSRIANEFATVELHYYGGMRSGTYVFDFTGRILKKVEVNSLEGSKATYVETEEYEYDPKDLKIEAPIK